MRKCTWGLLLVLLVVALAMPTSVMAQQEHSANKALYWSLLPGGGQVYNHQAWKIPIIYGAFAAVGYVAYNNYQLVATTKEEYLYRVNNSDTPLHAEYANYPTSNILSLYNNYNRNFQLTLIVGVGVYALNLIDAYVFGHLFDFSIDDELTMSVIPSLQLTALGYSPTVGFNFSF